MKSLKEDFETINKFINNPGDMNSSDQLQDAVYSILYSLSRMGKMYPTIRMALVRAFQKILREGL